MAARRTVCVVLKSCVARWMSDSLCPMLSTPYRVRRILVQLVGSGPSLPWSVTHGPARRGGGGGGGGGCGGAGGGGGGGGGGWAGLGCFRSLGREVVRGWHRVGR